MPDSKINIILSTIAEDAQHQKEEAVSGAEKRLEDALARARQQLAYETGDIKKRRLAEIDTRLGAQISAAENESRAGLFKRREEIRMEVFDAAKKQIEEFVEHGSYKELLITSAKRIVQTMKGQCAELILREADKKYATDICAILGNSITLHVDNGIKLGGIIVKSADGKMMIDDTLDERLRQQQQWFMENSGLVVE